MKESAYPYIFILAIIGIMVGLWVAKIGMAYNPINFLFPKPPTTP